MGRKDWDYITIPVEMANALDEIIKRNGRRYGIYDKVQLVRQLTGDFITRYDEENSIPEARRYVEEQNTWENIDKEKSKEKEQKGKGKITRVSGVSLLA